MEEKHKLLKWVIIWMIRLPWNIQVFGRVKKERTLILFTITKQQHSSNMNQKRHLLSQFTVRVIERKSRSHWHKLSNVCTEVTLETASLPNHWISSDCGWQHCTISGTNLNDVWSWKNAHHQKIVHYCTQNYTHLVYSISCDANGCSAYQDIPHNFMENTVYYKVQQNGTRGSNQARIVKIHPDTVC